MRVRTDIPAMKHKAPTTHVTTVIKTHRCGSDLRSASWPRSPTSKILNAGALDASGICFQRRARVRGTATGATATTTGAAETGIAGTDIAGTGIGTVAATSGNCIAGNCAAVPRAVCGSGFGATTGGNSGGNSAGASIGAPNVQPFCAGCTVCQVIWLSSRCSSNASHSRIFRRVYGGISTKRIPASFFVLPRHTMRPPVSIQSSDLGK